MINTKKETEKVLKLLKEKYQKFFEKIGIDRGTGCLKNNPKIKFATYPYIGSRYGQSEKILIIGLDMGKDEAHEEIQSFEGRRRTIEDKPIFEHNTHIAGTYITTLFYLKDKLGWNKQWNVIKNACSYQKALKDSSKLPPANPLSYIALTNYYKFVTVNRMHRTGEHDRKHINQEYEDQLLVDEIEILRPRIIIFQSCEFGKKKYDNLIRNITSQNKGIIILIAPHPSWHGAHVPSKYIKEIQKYGVRCQINTKNAK